MKTNSIIVGALGATILCSLPAVADSPVSVGTYGAIERATRTQGTARKGNAASFGTPAFEESRGFSLRLRIPLFLYGDEADAAQQSAISNIIPYASNARRYPLPVSGIGESPLDILGGEDLTALSSYIPAIEIGEERKPFHFQLGALSTRVGHGSQVHYFTNSPEGAERRMGLFGELNSASLGAQVMIGDVTNPGHFVSGRVYGRPILWFVAPDSLIQPNDLDLDPRGELAGMWVTGISGAIDTGFDGLDFQSFRPSWYVGWDNELAILDNKFVKGMFYLDLNMLGRPHRGLDTRVIPVDTGDYSLQLPIGVGAHPGVRANLEIPVIGDVDIEAEYNLGSDGYVPRYFDRLYFLERNRIFGTDLKKSNADAPMSHGYKLKANANIVKTISLFLEAQDQFPFQPSRGTNSAMLTAGASFFFMMFGAGATVSQAGIRQYTQPGLFGSGFILTAEGRVTLIANVIHIVGRYYRVHDPVDLNLVNRDYDVLEGALVGLEINFDLNTPIPLW